MYLKKIILENFQKHKNLELDFSDGVNVIHGQSDKGKSSIRRAVEWVFFNQNIDGIRKTGSKVTKATVILDNGTEVEKIRSASINRYVVRKGNDEQIFDKIGRNIPEEVKDALQIEPIEIDGEDIYLNSQNQLGLPFLMDKSPSARMKLFNKLTGNDVLDKLFSEFNKDILRIKRDKKTQEELFNNNIEELKNKKKKFEQKEIVYKKLKNMIESLKQKEEMYSKLLELNGLQQNNKKSIEDTENGCKSIKTVQPTVIEQLTTNIPRYNTLKELFKAFQSVVKELSDVTMDMNKIVANTHDFSELKPKISRVDTLKDVCYTYNINKESLIQTTQDIKDTEKNMILSIRKYKEILKDAGVCPTCKNNITNECLKEIKL